MVIWGLMSFIGPVLTHVIGSSDRPVWLPRDPGALDVRGASRREGPRRCAVLRPAPRRVLPRVPRDALSERCGRWGAARWPVAIVGGQHIPSASLVGAEVAATSWTASEIMIISSYISVKAIKGQSSHIQGRGLFAIAPIATGEIVAIKGGHLVDTATLHALPERLQNSDVQIADGFHLAATEEAEYEPVMLFINHSCEPNVGFAGNIVLVAMRDVAPGEELTTDYAFFDDHTGQMTCQCGTAACRGVVRGTDWRRPDLQRKYGRYFSSYLRDRFAGQQ